MLRLKQGAINIRRSLEELRREKQRARELIRDLLHRDFVVAAHTGLWKRGKWQ